MPKDPLTAFRMPPEQTARVAELAAAASEELGREVSVSEQIRTMLDFADYKGCPAGWTRPTRRRRKAG